MRYKVVQGSQSYHCCFDATVVDTTQPVLIRGEPYCPKGIPQFVAVCECFDETAANLVAEALNRSQT